MPDENTYTKTKSSHKKVYEVIKNTKHDIDGIAGQGLDMRFGKNGAFVTRDPKLAKEISDKFGYGPDGSRAVIVVERDEKVSNLHTVPAMPWKEDE